MAVFFILVLTSVSFGAVSQDMAVYVRQDVFDAKMEAMFERLHGEIVAMKNEIKADINELKADMNEFKGEIRADMNDFKGEIRADMNDFKGEIRGDIKALSERVDGNFGTLSTRIDSNFVTLSTRIDDLRQDIYLGLVVLGLIAAFPAVKEFLKWREERKEIKNYSLIMDEVRRLIAEAKLNTQAQI